MKYSKALIILTGFLVTTAAPAFSQEALGVNYNQFLQSIQEQEVSQVKATWIRGFLDMLLLGNQDPSQNADIQAILKAKADGCRTILNLKWNYETEPFPTSKYNLPASLEVYQFINRALQSPVADAEWRDFLESCPWYMQQSEFLLNAYNLFRSTGKLGVANYGMLQSWTKGVRFTDTSMPWLLNALFASATVKPRANGS